MDTGRQTTTELQVREHQGSPIWTAYTASDWTLPTLDPSPEEGHKKPDLGLLEETGSRLGAHLVSTRSWWEAVSDKVLLDLPHQMAAWCSELAITQSESSDQKDPRGVGGYISVSFLP